MFLQLPSFSIKRNIMRVFELYSGIGGLHYALRESGVPSAHVVKAIDINTSANIVYKFNFPTTQLLERNIQSLTEDDFVDIDMIVMSPPCQPFTRVGLQKDIQDNRTCSLIHIINLLPKLTSVHYIFLENVKGFEESSARDCLVETLNNFSFIYQEFMLTPSQFGIPNSRTRYYLIAKRNNMKFCFQTDNKVLENVPEFQKWCANCVVPKCISECLDKSINSRTMLSEKLLNKYGSVLDIVTPDSTRSCCFTKAYTHFVEGTGSVLCPRSRKELEHVVEQLKNVSKGSEEYLRLLKSLELRFFTPEEIARLMCFPADFKLPNILTDKQKYRLLGNSVNVYVVSCLLSMLIQCNEI